MEPDVTVVSGLPQNSAFWLQLRKRKLISEQNKRQQEKNVNCRKQSQLFLTPSLESG